MPAKRRNPTPGDILISASKAQRSTSEPQRSASKVQRSTSEPQRSALKAQPSASEPQRSSSKAQRLTSEPQRSTSKAQLSRSEAETSSIKGDVRDGMRLLSTILQIKSGIGDQTFCKSQDYSVLLCVFAPLRETKIIPLISNASKSTNC
ncbi:hypothetical protein [Nostoc sp. PCC 7524]|uniref:hypothetical protein n=1 Tax=Nostoc sp. (strain ATCC 29411 / PCC 7524) TaxID=28072 RepID=UPI00059F8E5F|nr:hypothetical protein [Nostoc sp. PCC 7524]